jgi:thymidylate synthase (FAD)
MNKATVIAYTKSIDPSYGTNIAEFVAYCARVSNPANQWNHETAGKLLDYLKRNKHFSPLEMADIVIEIETTRDIARQVLRHRSFSFQEFSQRYAEASQFSEPREARLQDVKNRQNSIEIDDDRLKWDWEGVQEALMDKSIEAYQWALERGIAKEVARSVLPEGLTMSRLYMKGSLRSWIHYLEVRLDETTQKEHRDLALKISDCIKKVMEGEI